MSFTNIQLRKIINEHFASKGKRMTHINSATKESLMKIVTCHSIELPSVPEKKKVEKKVEKKEHPFKIGKFEYTYEWDDDIGYYGGNFTTIDYEITKITKCFITASYIYGEGCIGEKIITKKYKIDFREYDGWFFTIDSVPIYFDKEFYQMCFKCKKVWNKYH